ncbi:hypothetical protein C6Y11_11905 [Lactiplantibacillus pentosus]|nr:hypothetical protein [Lactiplantibacillus pentosus]MCT3302250.1 hypothetical protein [Lactiplantibacillus pentosus]PRO76885.1 hypothetical protein C6Y09_17795 [Lactiplantibacillus pentosus]PRO78793.1 hypothetical protein C6Y11_11905 [Lactiplantibacillus pentosus]PRO86754.1 hypothetical protein C6Y10_00710 [Lactiplantibacillus pentosus]
MCPGCLRGLLTAGCLLERGFLATNALFEMATVDANRRSGRVTWVAGMSVKHSRIVMKVINRWTEILG